MHVTSGKRSIRLWSAEYLKSKGKCADLSYRYYVVESRNLKLRTKPNIMITYCLTVFPLTPNTWLWLTLNPDFVLKLRFAPACLELWSVAAFESWLVLYLKWMLLANFNGKEHLRHRAVSLRQHGFLVHISYEDTRWFGIAATVSVSRAKATGRTPSPSSAHAVYTPLPISDRF